MNKRIFIIEDEPDMIKIATDLLEQGGYTVNSATHPNDGLKKIRENPPDALLLDIQLPDKDGFEVLKEIKADPKTKQIPVVMVSVRSDETDVVVGLEMGAEDFISKPYRKRELLARIKTILRRQDTVPADQRLKMGPLELNYGSYTASISKKPLSLTPKEFELLGFLMQREGRVTTRATLSESVWGIQYTGSTRTIDVHIDNLRKKLGKCAKWIHSLKGIGYRFDPDD